MSDMSIGLSGLLAAQTALDVTGQNITNANTPGYALRQVQLAENTTVSTNSDLSGGTGVNADNVVRERDMALYGQVQSSNAGLSAATTESQYLNQIQSLLQEPTGDGISTQLDNFFSAWQALAANPSDPTVGSTLLDAAQQLAQSLQSLSGGLLNIQDSINQEIGADVSQANQLTAELAQNNQMTTASAGTGSTPLSLEDQRDSLVAQLAALTGATNTTPDQATAQVQAGGATLVMGNAATSLNAPAEPGGPVTIGTGSESTPVAITTGTIGALLQLSQTTIPAYLQQLNTLASGLISMVNEQHAEGISQNGLFTDLTGTNSVSSASAALSQAGLSITPTQGQLTINVTNNSTGAQTAVNISVNPTSESLNDLAAAISNSGDLTATVNGGKLEITAASGYSFDFAANQGTNILAALGMNPFFQGTDASNINVAAALMNNPSAIASGQTTDSGDGSNATAIANLASAASSAFGGATASGYWESVVTGIGLDTSNATQTQQSAQSMVSTLTQQEQAISGVSLDEEGVNMLQYQQLYQASAQYMVTVSQLMQSLLSYTASAGG